MHRIMTTTTTTTTKTTMMGLLAATALAGGAGSGGGCGKADGAADEPHGFAVTVAPVSLVSIGDARFTLRVRSDEGLVWEESDLLASRYGSGGGGLAYVAPCDASANPHEVELVLQALYARDGRELRADEYANPAPATRPLVRRGLQCAANIDTPVAFDLTLALGAEQGMVDISVDVADLFCSAKVDCVGDDGGPLMMLFDPDTGRRAETVVMGFACTVGPGPGDEAIAPTWLALSDVVIECGSGPTTYVIDPAAGEGQIGGDEPLLFERAIYPVDESLPGLDKCAWNIALGVREGAAAANCRLRASGTATAAPLDGGRTPDDVVYPYVHFDVTLTDGEGDIVCGRQPLVLASEGPVHIDYSDFAGVDFAHARRCGEPPTTTRLACGGTIDGIGATFTPSPDGVMAQFDGEPSRLYRLPGTYALEGCCTNDCCSD